MSLVQIILNHLTGLVSQGFALIDLWLHSSFDFLFLSAWQHFYGNDLQYYCISLLVSSDKLQSVRAPQQLCADLNETTTPVISCDGSRNARTDPGGQQKLQISHATADLSWALCNCLSVCPGPGPDLVNVAQINPKIYTDIRPGAGSDNISIFPGAQSRDKSSTKNINHFLLWSSSSYNAWKCFDLILGVRIL